MSKTSIEPPKLRWILAEDYESVFIQDQEHGLNLARLCPSGMGLTSDARALGQRLVNFLNELPAKDTLLYPFNLPQNKKK